MPLQYLTSSADNYCLFEKQLLIYYQSLVQTRYLMVIIKLQCDLNDHSVTYPTKPLSCLQRVFLNYNMEDMCVRLNGVDHGDMSKLCRKVVPMHVIWTLVDHIFISCMHLGFFFCLFVLIWNALHIINKQLDTNRNNKHLFVTYDFYKTRLIFPLWL